MRGLLLYFNGLLILGFAGFLIFTFSARAHVESAAHDYVATKTVTYAEPLVATAESLLQQKLVRAALTAQQEEKIRAELTNFRNQPREYLEALVGRGAQAFPAEEPILDKFAGWKRPVVDYYERTLARALLHVRVFAVTNFIAACLAFAIAYAVRDRVHVEQLVLSAVLFLAVVVSSLQFFDESTYFQILLNRTSTTGYPTALIGIFVWLYRDLGPTIRKVIQTDAALEPTR